VVFPHLVLLISILFKVAVELRTLAAAKCVPFKNRIGLIVSERSIREYQGNGTEANWCIGAVERRISISALFVGLTLW
jgi:hypothetical protein